VCDFYDIKLEKLFSSKRRAFNESKCAAIYLIRKLSRDRLKEIGLAFMLKKYSTVSSIIERVKSRMKNDQNLEKTYQKTGRAIKKESRADLTPLLTKFNEPVSIKRVRELRATIRNELWHAFTG